ncbi:MAG: hypothetical protein FJ147_18300 [Deltaproteobacteria bacterium]|nr:hypothetical protein [Deltaproteobacteria bacterium]
MYQSYKSVLRVSSLLLLVFVGSVFAQQSPSNQKIDNCMKASKCAVQLRGEATANPIMSFIVAEEVWAAFDEKDKNDLRILLKKKIEQAKVQAETYTDIPASAPFDRKAIANIRNTKPYSVILSRSQSSSGALSMIKKSWLTSKLIGS